MSASLARRTARSQLKARDREARNPASGSNILTATCLRHKIQLYMTPEGEYLQEDLRELANLFTLMALAAEHDRKRGLMRGPESDLIVGIVDKALQAIVNMTNSGWYWESRYCVLMDDAMDASILVSRRATDQALHVAFQELERMKR